MGARNINAIHGNNIPEIPNNLMNIEEMDENQQNLIPIEQQNLIVQERTISKKILAARLPTNLDKKTLSLEHDSLSLNKSYLKFELISEVNELFLAAKTENIKNPKLFLKTGKEIKYNRKIK